MLFNSHMYALDVFHFFSFPQNYFCLLSRIVFSGLSGDKIELYLQISPYQ